MSADNEVAILEMTDEAGHKSYRVAENVPMSYNILGTEVDHTISEQALMVFNIWKDAKEFYHSKDAHEYAYKLLEGSYYEYGTTTHLMSIDWDDLLKLAEDFICDVCKGSGWADNGHVCPTCDGSGLKVK